MGVVRVCRRLLHRIVPPLGCLVAFVAFLAVCAFFVTSFDRFSGQDSSAEKLERFRNTFSAYVKDYSSPPPRRETTGKPYIRGQSVAIEFHSYLEYEWSLEHFGQGKPVRSSYVSRVNLFLLERGFPIAHTPEEVSTVIWLEYDSVQAGWCGRTNPVGQLLGEHVTPSSRAHRVELRITIIDRTTATMVGERTLYGSEPYCEVPVPPSNLEIMGYLKTLPAMPP